MRRTGALRPFSSWPGSTNRSYSHERPSGPEALKTAGASDERGGRRGRSGGSGGSGRSGSRREGRVAIDDLVGFICESCGPPTFRCNRALWKSEEGRPHSPRARHRSHVRPRPAGAGAVGADRAERRPRGRDRWCRWTFAWCPGCPGHSHPEQGGEGLPTLALRLVVDQRRT